MPVSSSSLHISSIIDGVLLEDCGENIVFEGLEFDSREIQGGELFIALPGEKSHGNNFIEIALQRGAALIIADRNFPLPNINEKNRVILANNTLEAFWKIAAWWRDEINLPTFAVTGSVGKTTVKEMAAAILLQKGVGTYSLKSHNNHVGVPYTICRASRDHKWMVLEIGMNHRGEIGPLSELAKPDVAAITNIAPAHIGQLGSIEAIADEKLDIAKGLQSGGQLLINAQSEVLKLRLQQASIPQAVKTHFFGTGLSTEGGISEIESKGLEGISFSINLGSAIAKAHLRVIGRQNAWNACCAAVACRLMLPEISVEEVVQGLAKFSAPLMRLNLRYLADASVLIDDSYNANPASMRCAIELLSDLRRTGQRVGLVVGDMLELGDFATRYHDEIGEVIASVSPDFVIAVGENAKLYIKNLDKNRIAFVHCNNADEALKALQGLDFTFLLVKASRGIGLDKVVSGLIQSRGELPFEPQIAADFSGSKAREKEK